MKKTLFKNSIILFITIIVLGISVPAFAASHFSENFGSGYTGGEFLDSSTDYIPTFSYLSGSGQARVDSIGSNYVMSFLPTAGGSPAFIITGDASSSIPADVDYITVSFDAFLSGSSINSDEYTINLMAPDSQLATISFIGNSAASPATMSVVSYDSGYNPISISGTYQEGVWYSVQVRLNVADGTHDIWMNGVHVTPVISNSTAGLSPSSGLLISSSRGSGSTGYAQMDNFAVSYSYIQVANPQTGYTVFPIVYALLGLILLALAAFIIRYSNF